MDAARLEQLPPPTRHCSGGVVVYVNPDCPARGDLADLFRLPSILRRLPGRSSRLSGRTTVWQWHPEGASGPDFVVRQDAHGGLWGRVAGVLFLGARRMLNEFRLSINAKAAGVPTAAPVAVRTERAIGPLIRAHIVSETVAGAVNLLDLLKQAQAGEWLQGPQRRRLASAIASAVAAMHDAGIVHGDLNLKNLLVRGAFDRPEVFVIDFDKASLVRHVTLRQRMSNLLRLDRSVMKWAAARRHVCPADRLRVVRCYLERYPQWRLGWHEIARTHASKHLLHCASRERR